MSVPATGHLPGLNIGKRNLAFYFCKMFLKKSYLFHCYLYMGILRNFILMFYYYNEFFSAYKNAEINQNEGKAEEEDKIIAL